MDRSKNNSSIWGVISDWFRAQRSPPTITDETLLTLPSAIVPQYDEFYEGPQSSDSDSEHNVPMGRQGNPAPTATSTPALVADSGMGASDEFSRGLHFANGTNAVTNDTLIESEYELTALFDWESEPPMVTFAPGNDSIYFSTRPNESRDRPLSPINNMQNTAPAPIAPILQTSTLGTTFDRIDMQAGYIPPAKPDLGYQPPRDSQLDTTFTFSPVRDTTLTIPSRLNNGDNTLLVPPPVDAPPSMDFDHFSGNGNTPRPTTYNLICTPKCK